MIVDHINNAAIYRSLGPRIAAALDYLRTTDFSKVAAGRYELDGANLFALVQRYQPKPLSQAVWESHRGHIDVQFIATGIERMGYVSLINAPAVVQPYDPDKDVVFYAPGSNLLTFPVGSFAIFTPQDIHAPGLSLDDVLAGAEVLKVVVKVRVEPNTTC